MTELPAAPKSSSAGAVRGLGIAALVLALLGILPIGLILLAMQIDNPAWGWLLFPTAPVTALLCLVGLVLAIVGLVLAIRRGRSTLWPIVGGCVALLPLLVLVPAIVTFIS